MKKLVSVVLALLMIAALAGCGAEKTEENEITKLYSEGYQCTMSTATEGSWKGVFQKEDSYDTLYMVMAAMSAEEYEAYDAIPYDDEDADAQKEELLGKLSDVTVTDITDKIPTQEELDAYVGKTLGDLENDGFENTGYSIDDKCLFSYDGPVYCCTVTLDESTKIKTVEDLDNYSANDLRALKIAAVEFSGMSSMLLDAE
ncbi:MAG: hypothetical protein KBS74_02075 [Clostridiales bacterium]|nr:hypothetical protein [Candidatus Cacconaster stercorequi]